MGAGVAACAKPLTRSKASAARSRIRQKFMA